MRERERERWRGGGTRALKQAAHRHRSSRSSILIHISSSCLFSNLSLFSIPPPPCRCCRQLRCSLCPLPLSFSGNVNVLLTHSSQLLASLRAVHWFDAVFLCINTFNLPSSRIPPSPSPHCNYLLLSFLSFSLRLRFSRVRLLTFSLSYSQPPDHFTCGDRPPLRCHPSPRPPPPTYR